MGKRIILFVCLILFSSCASSPKHAKKAAQQNVYFNQAQVNALVASGRFERASQLFSTHQSMYGSKNELLYLMDRAYTLQLAGKYDESIRYFEQAKNKIDALYTRSVSNIASTWMVNDNLAPYRGEAFEHILVNVLQGLNYLTLGDLTEALVEARDADRKFQVLCDLYCHQKNIYSEDGFARMLFGIMYESQQERQDVNDALISYKKALQAYENGFYKTAARGVPRLLKENALAVAQYLGFPEFRNLQQKFNDVAFVPFQEKSQKGEIYLIHFNGLSPLKHATNVAVPLPDGVVQLAFPQYDPRDYEIRSSELVAVKSNGQKFSAGTEVAADVEAIAKRSLEGRKAWLYTKAALRPLGKYAVESRAAQRTEEEHGELAGWVVRGASSLYNLYSEQADVRSWQTLPAEIRIGRVIVAPGKYRVQVKALDADQNILQEEDVGEVELKAGDKKFILIRTIK